MFRYRRCWPPKYHRERALRGIYDHPVQWSNLLSVSLFATIIDNRLLLPTARSTLVVMFQKIVAFCQRHSTKPSHSELSPPSTPEPETPLKVNRGKRRFVHVNLPCEWCEMYRPGGFHPVNLGDMFRDGAYTVVRKLGYGAYSTVWLAVDSCNKRYVALKIMTANASEFVADTELEMINTLSKKSETDSRSQYIVTLLDTFMHEGPNGKHRCLVVEPMGPSAESLVSKLPDNLPTYSWTIVRYPKWMAKRILLHSLRGLAFLHENNIVHGDVQPGNLLFSLNDISNVEENELRQDGTIPHSVEPVCRRDGKTDKWAPKNLYLAEPLYQHTPLGQNMKVKISDLGSAFWASSPPSKHSSPLALRAPEIILGRPFGSPIDIWAFGCLVFEFLAGRSLFLVIRDSHGERGRTQTDDDHLLQFNDIIRKLPTDILNDWPSKNKWFDPMTLQPRKKSRIHQKPLSQYDSLEVMFSQSKADDVDDAEAAEICSLIRQILVYSPDERPSATELLKHPWFSE